MNVDENVRYLNAFCIRCSYLISRNSSNMGNCGKLHFEGGTCLSYITRVVVCHFKGKQIVIDYSVNSFCIVLKLHIC